MSKKIYQQSLLDEIYHNYKNCQRCPLAQCGRTHIIFGDGNPNANLMLIGEAPGKKEDLEGKPFVGRAGELLGEILNTLKIKRSDIFIANIAKCRPPKNRLPMPEEINECIKLLKKQIQIIQPRIICTLGSCSTKALLVNEKKITLARGKTFKYDNITIVPTFHPAYILRNPKKFDKLFEDIRLATNLSM